MIDLNAPIVPWEGMGGIKLYSHLRDLQNLIKAEHAKSFLYDNFLVRYDMANKVYLFFNLVNGKLFKITALKNYKGKLFGQISIGMHIDEVLKIEPSFIYDDFEEVYCGPKGIYIEAGPVDHTVLWISVYIKEINNDDFEKGCW